MRQIKLLVVFSFLAFFNNVFGQDPQIDIIYGKSSHTYFVMGISMKYLYKETWGLYFHTDGIGTAYTGETNVDYSSISDRTEYSDYADEKNVYGMSFGLTYDLSKFLKTENSGLTLFLGTGYAVKETVSSRYEYYIWDHIPSLNEGNIVTWISDSKTIPIAEVLIGYDFIKNGMLRLNLNVGYATTHGFIGCIGLGLSIEQFVY